MEQFFKDYEHTISALGAFFTFIAVVTSLWVTAISSKAHRTKITANGSIRIIGTEGVLTENLPKYLMVSVTNIGLMRAKITFYGLWWNYPFAKQSLIIRPFDGYGDAFVGPRAYPVAIEPNESDQIVMAKLAHFEAMFDEKYIGKGIRSYFVRFITLRIATIDGRVFKVKLDKQVKAIIRANTRLLVKK